MRSRIWLFKNDWIFLWQKFILLFEVSPLLTLLIRILSKRQKNKLIILIIAFIPWGCHMVLDFYIFLQKKKRNSFKFSYFGVII